MLRRALPALGILLAVVLAMGSTATSALAAAVPGSGTGASGVAATASGCTLTIGYYKNHEAAVTPLLPQWLGTAGQPKALAVTRFSQARALMEFQPGGASNGIAKLRAQLLAARLSMARGASPAPLASILPSVDAFLGANDHGAWNGLSAAMKNQVNAWASAIDAYNNGQLGVPHCDSTGGSSGGGNNGGGNPGNPGGGNNGGGNSGGGNNGGGNPGNPGGGNPGNQGGSATTYHLAQRVNWTADVCGTIFTGWLHEQQQYTLTPAGQLNFHYIANGQAEGVSPSGSRIRLILNNREVDHIFDTIVPDLGPYGGSLQGWVQDNARIIVQISASFNERQIVQGDGIGLINHWVFAVNHTGTQVDSVRFVGSCTP